MLTVVAAAVAAVGDTKRGRHYPHPPRLPIRWMCGKVHRDLSDAISHIAATYTPIAGCSVWNFLSIYLGQC